ncbi:AAA family ATPase [Adhaeretor mobilis]|uniref:Septum site-determining protein MinD n=1 Tax=Adhaeretor mobilis TaxID=1930276 RepID=A0A517MVR4_9BACT|nr:AAA family ATPase [Adhaeretor mobilis]QDS98974.1 Septum site-determining protein MinD [Adhaeretor mobilis]
MANALRIAVVDPNDSSREAIKNTLLELDTIWLEAECSRYDFFVDVVEQTSPDIALVAMDSDPERATELIGEVIAKSPDCSVLVASSSADGQLILKSMRAGAKEFLTQPLGSEELTSALMRVKNHIGGQAPGTKGEGCKIFTIAGSTGGVGSTSIAVNLACTLAAEPENLVVLLDLDLALGDADVFLDAIPEYTLADVAMNVARLDLTLLKKSLTKHSSGVHLLPRPIQLEDVRSITPDDLSRVIGLLKTTFTHIVIDTSKGYGDLDMLALRQADEVLMLTQLDLPCLRNVVRLMMSFDAEGDLRDKVRIVVNRVGQESGQISLKKAQETLGRDIFWQIPNDYRIMVEVRNNGVPLIEHAPKASITRAIGDLGDALCGKEHVEDEAGESRGRGWLNFLPKR